MITAGICSFYNTSIFKENIIFLKNLHTQVFNNFENYSHVLKYFYFSSLAIDCTSY